MYLPVWIVYLCVSLVGVVVFLALLYAVLWAGLQLVTAIAKKLKIYRALSHFVYWRVHKDRNPWVLPLDRAMEKLIKDRDDALKSLRTANYGKEEDIGKLITDPLPQTEPERSQEVERRAQIAWHIINRKAAER